MKHHEVIVDFNRRGMAQLFKRVFAQSRSTSQSQDVPEYQLPMRGPLR